jgi:hypothetical protein
VVQDHSPPIQRDPTAQTSCGGPSPDVEVGAQSFDQLALCQLALAARIVSGEEDDGETASQDLIEAVDEDAVMGGGGGGRCDTAITNSGLENCPGKATSGTTTQTPCPKAYTTTEGEVENGMLYL